MKNALLLILSIVILAACSQKTEIGAADDIANSSALLPDPSDTNPPLDPDEETQILSNWTAWWTTDAPTNQERIGWSRHTLKELQRLSGASLIVDPKDLSEYCPKWKTFSLADRKGFYLSLISAMAKFESGFDPKTEYQENFKDANGQWVISRGLLQLSVESANGYGCNVKEKDLHDPLKNLTCAIKILDRWVGKDDYFGTSIGNSSKKHYGGARYWAVLRTSSKSRQKILKFTLSQKLCQ